MAYDFKDLNQKLEETKEWLKGEFSTIRTGQASVSILDKVQAEAYGVPTPINQLANINIEDPKTLRITPYDLSQVKEIESAITKAELGVSISVDDAGLRISFPEMTTERREEVAKQVDKKLEEARIRMRQARDFYRDEIASDEKNRNISEDEKYRYQEELQKICDAASKEMEEMSAAKKTQILS